MRPFPPPGAFFFLAMVAYLGCTPDEPLGAACFVSAECGAGAICVDNSCIDDGLDSGEGEGEGEDPQVVCGDQVVSASEECEPPGIGGCGPDCQLPGKLGDPCAPGDGCEPALLCDSGQCAAGVGAACTQEADCALTLTCVRDLCAFGSAAVCGDGLVDPLGREECDTAAYLQSACNADCTSSAPDGWDCPARFFGDGLCHCGCEAVDIDCGSGDTPHADCDICGGCNAFQNNLNASVCPGTLDSARGQFCGRFGSPTCGDSIINPLGENCDPPNDLESGIGQCPADCFRQSPPQWTCPWDFYGSNDGCDCGCGALDADCASDNIGACEFCANPGSCATDSCDGLDTTNTGTCTG